MPLKKMHLIIFPINNMISPDIKKSIIRKLKSNIRHYANQWKAGFTPLNIIS